MPDLICTLYQKCCVSVQRVIQRASQVGRKYTTRLIPFPYIIKETIDTPFCKALYTQYKALHGVL